MSRVVVLKQNFYAMYLYNALLNFSIKPYVFVVKFPGRKILVEVRELSTNARLAPFEGTSKKI